MALRTPTNHVLELTFTAQGASADPCNDIELDLRVTPPSGDVFSVPAFWAGGATWRARLAGSEAGHYKYETVCSDASDAGLHGRRGDIEVFPADTDNSLLRHGRLRVAADRRHFEHADGTPFYWLGDTWWMGLSTRLPWPDGFRELTADRVEKGFNVIQIVAGPYPDMPPFDPRNDNEAGHPFEADYARINPAYYDHADLKIAHLVNAGLMPCIVGMWGYHLPFIGVDRIKRFWRNLVARYGAWPVVWCVAGEGAMPYYLSEDKEGDAARQREGWTEVARHIRKIDGYHNLVTIHPTQFGREQVEDPSVLDFEMLQSGHSDLDSVGNTIRMVRESVARESVMPVIESEVNYEGICGRCWENIQRLDFYHAALNGAAGFTYGANGIWQMNLPGAPYGPSPHGATWGDTPWQEAAQLPGGRQVALGGLFMADLPWWELERHDEWLDAPPGGESPYGFVAVGIPGRLRVIYLPFCWDPPAVVALEAGVSYKAHYFSPRTGERVDLGTAVADPDGKWAPPCKPPQIHDWLLVLENQE